MHLWASNGFASLPQVLLWKASSLSLPFLCAATAAGWALAAAPVGCWAGVLGALLQGSSWGPLPIQRLHSQRLLLLLQALAGEAGWETSMESLLVLGVPLVLGCVCLVPYILRLYWLWRSCCSEVNTGVLPVLLLWGNFSNSPRGSSAHLNFIFYPENLIWPVLNLREKGKSFVCMCAKAAPCCFISFCKVLGWGEINRCKIQCSIEHWCFNSSGIKEQILLPIPGIVKEDPKLPEDKILPPPSPRPQNSIFDTDEEKSKVNLRVFMPNTPPPPPLPDLYWWENRLGYILGAFAVSDRVSSE